MTRQVASSGLQRLHDLWEAFEEAVQGAPLDEEQAARIRGAAQRYRDEAVVYRLSGTGRTEELKLQIKNAYHGALRPEWFGELNADELSTLLPDLLRASMYWDPGGNAPLVDLINTALDALPPDRARDILLITFAAYLQSFGYYTRAGPGERGRILREYMGLGGQSVYRSRTAQDNREALGAVIRDLLGEEAVPIYEAGLAAARTGLACSPTRQAAE